MSGIDASRLLQLRTTILNQNSALQRAAGDPASAATQNEKPSFDKTLIDAVQAVNAQQAKASDASAAYDRGMTTDIVSVMVERQKASIGFEATLQVRNKLLSAYRDIMNMPV
jgi:flagellar hook-basal body complex protein FliE